MRRSLSVAHACARRRRPAAAPPTRSARGDPAARARAARPTAHEAHAVRRHAHRHGVRSSYATLDRAPIAASPVSVVFGGYCRCELFCYTNNFVVVLSEPIWPTVTS